MAAYVMRYAVLAVLLAFAAPVATAAPAINSNVSAPSGNTVLSPVVPASLAGNASYTSACIPAGQYRSFDVFAAVAGAATLQVQRYSDLGTCVNPVGAAVPATALALTNGGKCPGSTYCGDVGSNDGLSFLAIKVTLTDTSNATNAITALTLTQGAE